MSNASAFSFADLLLDKVCCPMADNSIFLMEFSCKGRAQVDSCSRLPEQVNVWGKKNRYCRLRKRLTQTVRGCQATYALVPWAASTSSKFCLNAMVRRHTLIVFHFTLGILSWDSEQAQLGCLSSLGSEQLSPGLALLSSVLPETLRQSFQSNVNFCCDS